MAAAKEHGMKDFVIVGTGDFADLVADVILNGMNRKIAGYVVDRKYLTEDSCQGLPVRAYEEIENWFPPDDYAAVIGFYGAKMCEQRYEKYMDLKAKGYEMENVIHPAVDLSPRSQIGDGNIFLQYSAVAVKGIVGNCNFISSRVYIAHDVKIGNANHIASGVSITGYAEIGNHCVLGVNSAVNNKVKVADYTFVGGGIFLSHNTKPYEIYMPDRSVPVKRIRSVDFQIFTSRREE